MHVAHRFVHELPPEVLHILARLQGVGLVVVLVHEGCHADLGAVVVFGLVVEEAALHVAHLTRMLPVLLVEEPLAFEEADQLGDVHGAGVGDGLVNLAVLLVEAVGAHVVYAEFNPLVVDTVGVLGTVHYGRAGTLGVERGLDIPCDVVRVEMLGMERYHVRIVVRVGGVNLLQRHDHAAGSARFVLLKAHCGVFVVVDFDLGHNVVHAVDVDIVDVVMVAEDIEVGHRRSEVAQMDYVLHVSVQLIAGLRRGDVHHYLALDDDVCGPGISIYEFAVLHGGIFSLVHFVVLGLALAVLIGRRGLDGREAVLHHVEREAVGDYVVHVGTGVEVTGDGLALVVELAAADKVAGQHTRILAGDVVGERAAFQQI